MQDLAHLSITLKIIYFFLEFRPKKTFSDKIAVEMKFIVFFFSSSLVCRNFREKWAKSFLLINLCLEAHFLFFHLTKFKAMTGWQKYSVFSLLNNFVIFLSYRDQVVRDHYMLRMPLVAIKENNWQAEWILSVNAEPNGELCLADWFPFSSAQTKWMEKRERKNMSTYQQLWGSELRKFYVISVYYRGNQWPQQVIVS